MLLLRSSVVAQSGGALTELGTNAASLSAGEFGQFELSDVPSISDDATTSVMEYVSRIGWDATNKKLRFIGISHGTGVAKYLEYRDATNDWTQEDESSLNDDFGPNHAFSGIACDQAGQTFYYSGNGGSTVYKRSSGGVYTAHTNPQSGWGNIEWHPGLSRLVIGQIWGIRTYNPADNAFALIHDPGGGASDVMSDGPGASAYSAKDGCVYVGNTGDDNPGIWKVDSSGVCTQIANAPVAVRIHDAQNNTAMLCGSGSSSNKLLAIRQNAECYEYDEVGDEWSEGLTVDAGLVSFLQGATNNQWIAGPISTYGVIAFFRESPLATFDGTYWLWKR